MTRATEERLLKIVKSHNLSNELTSVVQKLRTRSDLSMVKIVSVAVEESAEEVSEMNAEEFPEEISEMNAEDLPEMYAEDNPPPPKKLKFIPFKNTGLNYLCVNCKVTFNTPQELSKHNRTQGMCKYMVDQGDSRPKCPNCSLLFSTRDVLSRHIAKCEKAAQENILKDAIAARLNYRCNKCPMRFKTLNELNEHIDTPGMCLSFRDYKCLNCNIKFNTSTELQEHMITPACCEAIERDKNKCDICGIQNKSLRDLYNHKMENHSKCTAVLFLNCDDCGSKFRDHFTFENHKINVHAKVIEECDSAKNICRLCMKKFPTRVALFSHVEEYGKKLDWKNPWKNLCHKCGKLFQSNYALREHIDLVHKKQFKCPKCEFLFAKKSHLEQHNCSKNLCRLCMKWFPSREELLRHIEEYQKNVERKCDICGKTFQTAYDLQDHIEQIHKEEYKCSKCLFVFATKSDLDEHVHSSRPASTRTIEFADADSEEE